jgi:hypothetical protein
MSTPSRRFDRQPETAVDTRFFDLRESGYDGWIDQDGYPVHDKEAWMNEHAPAWWSAERADVNHADAADADEM